MPAPTPRAATIPELFAATVSAGRDEPALGEISAGRLTWLTWGEMGAKAAAWETVLSTKFGVAPGDRVAQFSPNCLDWIVTDLALQSAGAVHVPLHASLAGPQAGAQ